jgi:hypothetical protein
MVLAHQPQHALLVDAQPLAPEQRGDPPVAIMPVRQRQALHGIAHRRLLPARRRGLPGPVIARAADAGERTHPLDRKQPFRENALRSRHRLDEASTPSRQARRSAGMTPRLGVRLA